MRNLAILLTATTLAACGGGGTQSVSSSAAATPATPATPGTPSSSATDLYAQFVSPTVARTYAGIGYSHVLSYTTDARTATNGTTGVVGSQGQQALTYAGNASTVRDSKITLSYDPRDAIFTLQVTDPKNNATTNTRFQDPGSRTNFGGAVEPQWGNDDFSTYTGIAQNSGFKFLQAGDGNPLSPYGQSGSGFINPGNNNTPPTGTSGSTFQSTTLFYETPGSKTRYVSLAGFVRNDLSWVDVTLGANTFQQAKWKLDRGAFAYGILTDTGAVPKTGSGTYTGSMIGTMVINPTLDEVDSYPTYFQWMSGTSSTTVNFATGAVALELRGTLGRGIFDLNTTPHEVAAPAGTLFSALGTATVDLARTGGFTGQFQTATFTVPGEAPGNLPIAGSSIDGAFFGPAAEEIGGGFRIVGGTPDQRIDIGGAFTGKKP